MFHYSSFNIIEYFSILYSWWWIAQLSFLNTFPKIWNNNFTKTFEKKNHYYKNTATVFPTINGFGLPSDNDDDNDSWITRIKTVNNLSSKMTRNKSNRGYWKWNRVKGLNHSSKTFKTHLPKLTNEPVIWMFVLFKCLMGCPSCLVTSGYVSILMLKLTNIVLFVLLFSTFKIFEHTNGNLTEEED